MPEDAPGDCVGEDAEKVAAYIYASFYSKLREASFTPSRIELSRLTVRQYKYRARRSVGKLPGPDAVG